MSIRLKGDQYTKLLRRRLLEIDRHARLQDKLDELECESSTGVSDHYFASQRMWAQWHECNHALQVYLAFKGWKKTT